MQGEGEEVVSTLIIMEGVITQVMGEEDSTRVVIVINNFKVVVEVVTLFIKQVEEVDLFFKLEVNSFAMGVEGVVNF
jgi:hypothetical protein